MMFRTGKHTSVDWENKTSLFLEKIGRPLFRLVFTFFKLGQLSTKKSSQAFRVLVEHRKKKPAKRKVRQKKLKDKSKLKLGQRKLVIGLGVTLAVCGLVWGGLHFWLFRDLPDPNRLIDRDHIVSTKIYDRHGQLLYKMYRSQNRTLVELDKIPNYLAQATLAIEDAEFWEHQGFSWRGITRSLVVNIREGKLQGGSTITQQLVKNALLTPEKTLSRKLKELILSIRTELRFSKEEILQMYLNEVGYGGTAYGAEEAAWRYFGKSVRDLNLAESALIAGLPGSPTRYSPFGAHPELAKQRQVLVLHRMASEGFISQQEAQEAQAVELKFNYQTNHLRAPHFVMYVKDQLVERFGEQKVEEGGLEVKTSLDLNIQNLAETILSKQLDQLKSLHVTNGAVLITQPQTGEILAMVGSKDYFDPEIDGNVNVTLQPRQPGSAIKPVTYALALQNGYTPATLIADTPVSYQIPGQPAYTPVNYDGRFHGKITLRQALACSYNVPAVKVLSSLGVPQFLDFGQKLGITTWDEPEKYGLALTLGSAEVKMIDLAVAYGAFANLGEKKNLKPILTISDYKGRQYPEDQSESAANQFVVDPRVAFLINDILADNRARTPTFGSHSSLVIPNQRVAVKTGTSNLLRDNWTVGYTPQLLVSVWVGNNDNTPMSRIASGVTGASPVWQELTSLLLGQNPLETWPIPEGVVLKTICPSLGTLSCPGCSVSEYFLEELAPQKTCQPIVLPETREQISSISSTSPTPLPSPVKKLPGRKNQRY